MESSQATAESGRHAMKIYFCDGCNESIPLSDIQAGQVTTVKGKLFCRNCIPPGGMSAAAAPAPAVHRGAGPVVVTLLLGLIAYTVWRDLPPGFGGPGDGETRAELAATDDPALAVLQGDVADLRTSNDELDRKLTFQHGDVASLRSTAAELQRVVDSLRESIDGLQRGQAETGQLIEKLNLQENRMHALEARIDTLADMVASQQQMLALRASEPQAAAQGTSASASPGIDPTVAAEMEAIRRQLKDADAGHRFDAVDRVAKGRSKQPAPDLLSVLKDEDPFVRTRAMQVLGDFGSVEAVPMLLDVLEDPNPIIRKAAAEALVRLTGYDPGFDPRGSEADRKKAVKKWREWAGGEAK
jgi:uncharacterized coiled-coil protein SlyX